MTVPPDIMVNESSSDQVVTEGSNVSLVCAATGYPVAKITWRREDNRLINGRGNFPFTYHSVRDSLSIVNESGFCGISGAYPMSLKVYLPLSGIMFSLVLLSRCDGRRIQLEFHRSGSQPDGSLPLYRFERFIINSKQFKFCSFQVQLNLLTGVPPSVSKRIILQVECNAFVP